MSASAAPAPVAFAAAPYGVASPYGVAAPQVTYAAAPQVYQQEPTTGAMTYAAGQPITYAADPAAAAPVTYAAAPQVLQQAVSYVSPAQPQVSYISPAQPQVQYVNPDGTPYTGVLPGAETAAALTAPAAEFVAPVTYAAPQAVTYAMPQATTIQASPVTYLTAPAAVEGGSAAIQQPPVTTTYGQPQLAQPYVTYAQPQPMSYQQLPTTYAVPGAEGQQYVIAQQPTISYAGVPGAPQAYMMPQATDPNAAVAQPATEPAVGVPQAMSYVMPQMPGGQFGQQAFGVAPLQNAASMVAYPNMMAVGGTPPTMAEAVAPAVDLLQPAAPTPTEPAAEQAPAPQSAKASQKKGTSSKKNVRPSSKKKKSGCC